MISQKLAFASFWDIEGHSLQLLCRNTTKLSSCNEISIAIHSISLGQIVKLTTLTTIQPWFYQHLTAERGLTSLLNLLVAVVFHFVIVTTRESGSTIKATLSPRFLLNCNYCVAVTQTDSYIIGYNLSKGIKLDYTTRKSL